jgi:alkyl sulfatase BDS1-like metallo-beta-lactamase superfamily hydrolase
MELLNKLVYAEPGNIGAKQLLADVFEQIGYQKESSSLRNAFLAAALELRSGMPSAPAPAIGPDILRSLTTEQLLDLAAIQLDSEQAEGQRFTLNLVIPDIGEKFVVELSNATLTHIQGMQAGTPDATLTVDRSDLLPLLAGMVPMETLIESGKARLDGDGAALARLRGLLVSFKPDFEIMPGTRTSTR